jgi:hypothetical protein
VASGVASNSEGAAAATQTKLNDIARCVALVSVFWMRLVTMKLKWDESIDTD